MQHFALDDLSLGDVVCLVPVDEASAFVVLATPAALAARGRAYAIVKSAGTTLQGSPIELDLPGAFVPISTTGLEAVAGNVRVGPTGRCEYVASLAPADFPLGYTGGNGTLTFIPRLPVTAAPLLTLAALQAVANPGPGAVFGVAEVGGGLYENIQGDTTTPDGWTVLTSANGRWHLRSNRIRLKSLGGTSDDWPRLFGATGAVTAMAYKGYVELAPDTPWNCKSLQQMYSGSHVVGSSGVVIQCALGVIANVQNAPFSGLVVDPVQSTTLAANNTPGAYTLSLTGNMGGAVIAGAILEASNGLRCAVYEVTSVAGSGPYTVTVDRPVRMQFLSTNTVRRLTSIPSDIRIDGNGMIVQGTADRFIEMIASVRCRIRGMRLLSPAAHTDLMASFDVGGYDNVFEDIEVDGAGIRSLAIALESNEKSSLVRCRVRRSTGYGIALYDCVDCSVVDCESIGNQNGIALVADANAVGCISCQVIGGKAHNNSQQGVLVSNGSSHCRIVGVSCNYNTLYGCLLNGTNGEAGNVLMGVELNGNGSAGFVTGAGSKLTQLVNCEASGNGSYAGIVGDEIDIAGFTADVSGNNGIIFNAGSYEVRLSHLNMKNVYGPNLYLSAGVIAKLGGARLQVSIGGTNPVEVFGKFYAHNLTITSGNAGVHVQSGGTFRRSGFFDASGASSPIVVEAGGFSSVGNVVANGVTGVDVTWPDIKASDHVNLTRKTDGGTPGPTPRVTITAGTKFTINATAGDTSTYEYQVAS